MEIATIKDKSIEQELLTGGSPACSGCPAQLGLKLALKALGKDTIVVNASGCMSLLCNYPNTPLKVPWIHNAIENAPATAIGIIKALKIRKRNATVLCYVGDGASYDIGFQSLSYAMSRQDLPLIYICYNNESYANTGFQWATSTPYLCATKTTPAGKKSSGNILSRKDMAQIMAAHKVYVATANVAFPLDYINKLRKAQDLKKPAYIEYFSPCQSGWGYEPRLGIKLSKLAVDAGIWPLYEMENNKLHITHEPKQLKPVGEFLKHQERYKHLTPAQTKEIQDWINKEWRALRAGEYWGIREY